MILRRGYLGHYDTLFKHSDVDKILQKGFAIIRKNGNVISDPAKIDLNHNLTIQLKETLIGEIVKKTEQDLTYDKAYIELKAIAQQIDNE